MNTKAVLAALCCQRDWIWNNLGDTSLDVSVKLFPERFNKEKRISPQTIPKCSLDVQLNKSGETSKETR